MATGFGPGKQSDLDLNVVPLEEVAEVIVEPAEVNAEPAQVITEPAEVIAQPAEVTNTKAPDDSDSCSVCWEEFIDSRTLVTLKCGHKFHLDCIGSSFSAKKMMECPYCRQTEPGQWRRKPKNRVILPDALIAEFNREFGIFSDVVLERDFCPFEGLVQPHSHEGPRLIFHEPECECMYAECSLRIPPPSAGAQVTRVLDFSSLLAPGAREVPNLEELHRNNRDLPLNYQPSNPKTFWIISEPGVISGRHYPAHPSLGHRCDSSMIISPMDLPSSSSNSAVSSSMSMPNPNNNNMSSHLGDPSAPVSHGPVLPYGSNQVNENNLNQSNNWDPVAFLDPEQQRQIENAFYRIIYSGYSGEGSSSGNQNSSGGGSNNDEGKGGDDGNNSFGGGGDGGNGGISGGGTS